MAKKNSLTASYDSLPLIIRVLIQIFAGVVAGGVYRIVRYFETKNLVTLLVGVLVTCTGVGNIISWIIDLYTLIRDKKYSLFVD